MAENRGVDDLDAPPAIEEEPEAVQEGAPLWALTFGDMMSLLLCFFVLMFSMSEVKVEKFLIAAESLRSGLGHGTRRTMADAGLGGSSAVDTDVLTSDPAPYDITIAMDDVDDFLELISARLESFVASNNLSGSVEVARTEDGVSLRIQELVLFDSGSADLRPESRKLMEELGRIVTEVGMPVVVSGHTDERPIHTRLFPSNWELSSARASTVTRILLAQGFPPGRVHVEGYAEFRPTDTNETAEGRAKNRRVEVVYSRQGVITEMVEEKKRALADDAAENGPVSPSEPSPGSPVPPESAIP